MRLTAEFTSFGTNFHGERSVPFTISGTGNHATSCWSQVSAVCSDKNKTYVRLQWIKKVKIDDWERNGAYQTSRTNEKNNITTKEKYRETKGKQNTG